MSQDIPHFTEQCEILYYQGVERYMDLIDKHDVKLQSASNKQFSEADPVDYVSCVNSICNEYAECSSIHSKTLDPKPQLDNQNGEELGGDEWDYVLAKKELEYEYNLSLWKHDKTWLPVHQKLHPPPMITIAEHSGLVEIR